MSLKRLKLNHLPQKGDLLLDKTMLTQQRHLVVVHRQHLKPQRLNKLLLKHTVHIVCTPVIVSS